VDRTEQKSKKRIEKQSDKFRESTECVCIIRNP
jgi:hypothetical protein